MAFEWQQFSVIGARFTRDPEPARPFPSGKAKSIRFGIAFTGERKKDDDGTWQNNPVFLDCDAIQFENGQRIVDAIEEKGKKGCKVSVIGTLKMETWEDKNGGGKRSAIKLKVTEIIFMADDRGGGDGEERPRKQSGGKSSGGYGGNDSGGGYGGVPADDPIPF